jgi:phosphoglycolate phosphatase
MIGQSAFKIYLCTAFWLLPEGFTIPYYMHYTHLFFDLDGTLIDSKEGILSSVKYFMDKTNIPENERPKDLNPFIGPPLRDSFRLLFGLNPDEADEATRIYREHYSEKGFNEYRVYPGIKEILFFLKNSGCSLSLVTSKAEFYAIKIIEAAGFSGLFDAVSGCMLNGERSKKHDLILYTLDQLKIKPSQNVIMIGDRYLDVKGAHAAGISSAAVLYGYGDRPEFNALPPDLFINRPEDLRCLANK